MHRRIFESSMGWNEKWLKWTHNLAPPIGVKKSGATSRMPAASSSR